MRSKVVALLVTPLALTPLALAAPALAGPADPPELAKAVITPDDFTFLGAFTPPQYKLFTDAGEEGIYDNYQGLTHRYVDGRLGLYTISGNGYLLEFEPPAELDQTAPFDQSADYTIWGDIYQETITKAIYSEDGQTVVDHVVGLNADGQTLPNGLWWDEATQRMYWAKTIMYLPYYTESLGYSTLDDATHTGTGVGNWRVYTGYTNAHIGDITGIPDWFANAYLGGRTVGLGFGGHIPGLAYGVSSGPALSAVRAPDPAVDPVNGEITEAAVNVLYHPYTMECTYAAERPEGLWVWEGYHDWELPYVTHWAWGDSDLHGLWIEGENKHGLLTFALMSSGYHSTTILDDPRNSTDTVVVADVGDIQVGDAILVPTVEPNIQGWNSESPVVESIEGNVLHLEHRGDGRYPDGAPLPSAPEVGGTVHLGTWYGVAGVGGGNRSNDVWYIYDPADLAQSATGAVATWAVEPASATVFHYPGDPDILRGGGAHYQHVQGATFDETTGRLYIMVGGAYVTVYVYEFDDSPAADTPDGDLVALLARILDLIRQFITQLLTLFA